MDYNYIHLFADSQFQIFNYPTGEVISVNDFPGYVKTKGKEVIEREYEVTISFLSDIYQCLAVSLRYMWWYICTLA